MDTRDALYYSDLVYYIKVLAGIITLDNPERFRSLAELEKSVEHHSEFGVYYTFTPFALELSGFVLGIVPVDDYFKTGSRSLKDYPEQVKEQLKDFYLKFSEDYTKTPGGRYISGGSFSGEDFRNNVLEKKYLDCLSKNRKLVIDFDGDCYGYPVGFLEEAFGGMVRIGYHAEELLNNIVFISNDDPELIQTITNFILDEEERVSLTRKNKTTPN